jgi:hypothetical protein
MDGYYGRLETQLRALTERGAHRQSRQRVMAMVAIAAAVAVVAVVAAVFLGLRGTSRFAPASPAPACTRADWSMTGLPARRLDGATVAGLSLRSRTTCHLRLTVSFALVNRSGALASALGTTINSTLAPGASLERRWAWRNLCAAGDRGFRPAWFRFTGGGRTVTVPVAPPPCVNPRETTGFGHFQLTSRDILSARRIGPAALGGHLGPTLVAISNLLGVWAHRGNGAGCGADGSEQELDGLRLFFGHGRVVGYEYSGSFLATTRGLRVGDTTARARQLYGPAFEVSAAQGGSWSAGGLRGYLTAPRGGRIATIDAGNVGCAALSP